MRHISTILANWPECPEPGETEPLFSSAAAAVEGCAIPSSEEVDYSVPYAEEYLRSCVPDGKIPLDWSLPSRLVQKREHHDVELLSSQLVAYSTRRSDGKRSTGPLFDSACVCVRADNPVPLGCDFYYYEVALLWVGEKQNV